ncbi:MAG: acyl-CoA dehydrogenase [Myxococcales bacterium]|nr:acyl-CoA dehydrogenase [Myxococcales bacterium]
MDPRLPDDVALLQTETRRLVDRELRPQTLAIERERAIPPSLIALLRSLGYFGVTIPERYGGMGASCLGHVVVQEELGRAHPAFNLLVSGNNGIGVMGLLRDGTDAQKERFLPRLASGEWIAAFALTEPNAGSDAAAIETRAEPHPGGGFRLHGVKHFITRADIAHLFTVFALTDPKRRARGGITAFLVEKGTPGFRLARIQESMGSDVIKQGELVFEDCPVDDDHVIGRVGEGFQSAMRVLDLGRLSLAARSLGMMEELLALSLAHARTRTQFKKPLAEQPAIQAMLADTATEIAMIRPALYQAAWRRDQGESVGPNAAMLKLFASEALGRAADRAVQIHGGMGFMKDCAVEHVYREARMMRIIEGTSEIQRMIIARDLLA